MPFLELVCPRGVINGESHTEFAPTGEIAKRFGRWGGPPYDAAQLRCLDCGYVFWDSTKQAIELAKAKGFAF